MFEKKHNKRYMQITPQSQEQTCEMSWYFVDVEGQLEGVAEQKDDHDQCQHWGDCHLPPLAFVGGDSPAPCPDGPNDPGVEDGQDGHREQVEEDGGEEHREGRVEGVQAKTGWPEHMLRHYLDKGSHH